MKKLSWKRTARPFKWCRFGNGCWAKNGSIKEIIQKEAAMEILQTEFCLNQQYASLFSGICSAKKSVEKHDKIPIFAPK